MSVTDRTPPGTTEPQPSKVISFSTNFLKSPHGILRLSELVLGVICVGTMSYSFVNLEIPVFAEKFFIAVTTGLMIITLIYILSCTISPLIETIISKTVYGIVHDSVAFVFLLTASLALLVHEHKRTDPRDHGIRLFAVVCGLINSLLYHFTLIFLSIIA